MIKITDKADCCGCSSCEQVCPRHCIFMSMDEEGFRYPKVNLSVCINCGLCEKVCPIINVEPEQINEGQSAFLLQLKDEQIRKESTSGGAFTAISNWVLDHGGFVYGAQLKYRENSNNSEKDGWYVRHCKARDKESLSYFRNSKYVQSDLENCFKEIKELLKDDQWVLFSGTPCQIEGLLQYLKKHKREKLVLVDVVCYGIPSPGVFRDYMEWKQKDIGGAFSRVLFREKRLCYNYTSFSIYNKDEKLNYHSGVEREPFMRSFFSDINVRPSCYQCHFKKRYRVSDFTIWDCYDVKSFSKNFDDNGTNRILIHSELGRKIFENIKPLIKFEQFLDIEKFIADEVALVKSVPKEPKRDDFFRDYAKMDIAALMQKWYPTTLKVRMNSFLRMLAFKLGIYSSAKRFVKKILRRN